jgi:hypothetical protein
MSKTTMRMAPGVNQNRRFVAVNHFSRASEACERHLQKIPTTDCHPPDI